MTEKEVKELFENMTPSEEEKREMFNNIFYSKNLKTHKKIYIKRCVVLFVAILIISTVSVFGYMKTKMEQYSTEIYKWSVSEFAKNLNISDTDKNITVTAETVFGDNENFYVLFSVSDKNGNPVKIKYDDENAYIKSKDVTVTFDKNDSYTGSSGAFAVNDLGDNKVYFVLHVETQRDDDEIQNIGQNLNVVINGLYTGKVTDLFDLSPENNGVWEFDIPLDYKNSGKDLILNMPFDYKGKTVYLDNIHYSPLDIGVHLKSDEGNLEDFTYSMFEGTVNIAVETTKGRIYPISSNGKNDGTTVDLQYNMINFGVIKPEDVIGLYYYERESENGDKIVEKLIPINISE